jgi:xylulokinase
MSRSAIGIDIGTSAVKGLLLVDDAVVARSRRAYPLDVGPSGRVEVDAERVARAAGAVIRRLGMVAKGRGRPVGAIAASGSGDEAVWIDAAGRVVAPVPMALDTRAADEVTRLAAVVGEDRLFATTGLPLTGIHPLARLLWLRDVDPTAAGRVEQLLAWPEFLALRLGLAPLAEPSLAARSLAFDVGRRRYDPAILAAARASADLFPPLVATGAVVGELAASTAGRLGLATPAILVAGGFDQAMATFGAGIVEPGTLHLGLGSWAATTTLTRDRPAEGPMRSSALSIGPSVAGWPRMAVMGSTAGGIVPAWLGSLSGPVSDGGPHRVAQLAARAPDRPTGLLGLSHLDGSYTPWLDPGSRGAIVGLGLATDAPTLARGLYEAIAYEIREIIGRMGAAGIPTGGIRATGRGSRSRTWLQIVSDVVGLPVTRARETDAGALAAACFAAAAIGTFVSPEEAVRAVVRLDVEIAPRPHVASAYRDAAERHAALYPALRDWRATTAGPR